MRIIDKNQDFYDYLQDPTDSLVFDRRGSFLLTKEMICDKLRYCWNKSKYRFLLLQCGANFWLFLLTITEYDSVFNEPINYELELLASWKNYSKKRELLKISLIDFKYDLYCLRNGGGYSYDNIKNNIEKMKSAINYNSFTVESNIGVISVAKSSKNKFDCTEKKIPLLKACGIGTIINPVEIFCSIEEYFSLEKTESERTEAIGATNNDKITMHGFDIKTSFRKGAFK